MRFFAAAREQQDYRIETFPGPSLSLASCLSDLIRTFPGWPCKSCCGSNVESLRLWNACLRCPLLPESQTGSLRNLEAAVLTHFHLSGKPINKFQVLGIARSGHKTQEQQRQYEAMIGTTAITSSGTLRLYTKLNPMPSKLSTIDNGNRTPEMQIFG